MALAFIRQARVEIAPPGLAFDARLRIAFEVHTAIQSKPPASTITLTNLAESTVAQLRTPASLRLRAGYRGYPLDQLFAGEVARIATGFEGQDRLTRLTLDAAQRTMRTAAILQHTYQGVVSLRTVVRDIAQRLGSPVGSLDVIPELTIEDYVYSGKAEDALTGLLRPRGVEWYVVDDELRFRRRGIAPARIGFVLNESTGMIGSPERTDKGVRARMRLNALVRLNQRVRIESARLGGTYKVISLAHRGDTWDGEWQTELEAVPA